MAVVVPGIAGDERLREDIEKALGNPLVNITCASVPSTTDSSTVTAEFISEKDVVQVLESDGDRLSKGVVY